MDEFTVQNSSDDAKSYPRGHWRPAEDEKLLQLVQQHGAQNWNSIAEKLPGRSGKSCRLRWFNQLDPRINRRPFTEEEEDRLLSAHQIHGNKWSFIARLFPGRTDNAVKNHWHVIMARKQREQSKTSATKRSYHDAFSINSNATSSLNLHQWKSKSQEDFRSRIGVEDSRLSMKDRVFALYPSTPSSPRWPFASSKSPLSINLSSSVDLSRRNVRDCFNSNYSNFKNNSKSYFPYSSTDRVQSDRRVTPNPFGGLKLGDSYDTCGTKKNELLSLCNITTTRMNTTEKAQRDEPTEHKDIPYIDFLGVGISS